MIKLNLVLLSILLFYSFPLRMSADFVQDLQPQKELQHEVAVTLKLIQVYVTDKEGNPVTDLKKEDFFLWDNEKQQNITDFETHFYFLPGQESVPIQAVEIQDKTKPPPPRTPMDRKFFVFLDIQRNDPIGVIKSKRIARYFVETQLYPGDEVGVFSFQPAAGFVLHQYLTQDREKVLLAIKKARALPVTLDWFIPMDTMGPSWNSLAQPQAVFFYALEDLSISLNYIPGIKNIVLFSAGGGGKSTFDVLGKKLASSNCRVYTVDTNWKRHYLKGYFETGPGAALKQLALSSGGRSFEDPDEVESIAQQIQQMTSNYYVLGYYVTQEWDGKYHEIKVEVNREDCVVYAQKGYFNPKPYSQFSEAERKLHLADLAFSEMPRSEAPKPFSLEGLAVPGEDSQKLILLSEIRPENLEEVFSDAVEIITFVFDKEQNIIDSGRAVLDRESINVSPIHHYSITGVKPGDYEGRVIIRNLVSGKSALGTSSVEVPEFTQSKLIVYPPFLLIPDKKSVYLKAVKERRGKKIETLSLNEIYPFLSNNQSPLVSEVDRSIRNLHAVLRYSSAAEERSKIDIKMDLVHIPEGQRFPVEFVLVESGVFDADEILLLEIKLPYVEPDLYTLEVTLSLPGLDIQELSSRTFRIR